jgi:hypothetical protein
MPEPRLEHGALLTSIHEAGHAVERNIVFGTTGAVRPDPQPGKEAGAETEPLPPALLTPTPAGDGETLRDPPYSRAEVDRLLDEMKVALAGVVAEAINYDADPLDRLNEAALSSDAIYAQGIAQRLWCDAQLREHELQRLLYEVRHELDAAWDAVVRVAQSYEASPLGLSSVDVATAIRG